MPSVDELLNAAEVAVNETETNDIIEINADTRTMIIPDTERIFGVMSDEKGERKYFRCKRFVGNGIDLSKLSLRIIFQNASGFDTGRDKYIVTDLAIYGEDYVTFSWELSRKVTAYKGIISFIVCATKTNSDGTITNEWNTTLANGIVLEGLEANGTQEQEEVAKDYYNQLEAELLKVANEQKTELEKKAQEVIKTIPSDYTQIQKDVNKLNEDLGEISKFIVHVDKRNLLNNASVRENIAYNNWTGNTMYDTRELNGWYSIPVITVEAGKQYCFTYNNKKQLIESIYNYDKDGNFAGTITASGGVYTIPDECCYIALSRKNSFIGWNFREYIDGMDYSFVEYKHKDFLVYTKNEINEIIKPKFSVPTYYFSKNGSDLNSGLFETEPKQNPKSFIEAGNCNVLLRGGDTFKMYGILFGSNLSIKSYGNGKAKISGVNIEESEWLNDGNGYYSSVISEDMPSYIVIDGKEYWSKLIKSEPEKNGVWKFDRLNKKITIKFDVDISGEKVIYATGKYFGSIIDCENIVIDGIEVESVKSYLGINNSRNIVIKNCYVHHCGGGMQDYNNKQSTVENGGGVTVVLNGCKNIYCFKNVFDYMFDQALSAQMWIPEPDNSDSEEIYFCNNIVTRSWYGFEIFANDTNTTNRHHIVVKNNYFADQFDVTNGYREGDNVANNKYPALLMCWNMNGNNDIHINDNVFNRSNNGYAVVILDTVNNIFDVSGNIFVCNNSEKTSLIHQSAIGFVDSIITVLNPDTDGIIHDTAYEVIGKRKVGYNQLRECGEIFKMSII